MSAFHTSDNKNKPAETTVSLASLSARFFGAVFQVVRLKNESGWIDASKPNHAGKFQLRLCHAARENLPKKTQNPNPLAFG